MLNREEMELAALFQKQRITEKESFTEDALKLLTMSIAYTTQLHPNLDSAIPNPLTLREMTSLILLVNGKSMQQCADILGVSFSTVQTYEKRTREKLNTYNRAHSLCVAITRGFLLVKQQVIHSILK